MVSIFFAHYVWLLLSLLRYCWKILLKKSEGKPIIRVIRATVLRILERVFHVYQDPTILDKKHNIRAATIFNVGGTDNITAKMKTEKYKEDYPLFEDEQPTRKSVAYLARYVLQFEPEMKFLTNPFLQKKAKTFFENFIWFYCEFLLGFLNLVQNKPSRLSFLLSGVFFFM